MNTKAHHKELGFLALVSIVIGSQVGSGTFVFPSMLAPFGSVGLLGWIVSVSGAISLALIFSELSSRLPKNGGPHVYVTEAFGKTIGFFTAWIYWIISWSSNSVLLVTTTYYLSIITGDLSSIQIVIMEVTVLFVITFINILGVRFSGIMETVLGFLKVIPLLLIPILFFMFFNIEHFKLAASLKGMFDGGTEDSINIIAKTALLTSWGFIGVECATTPAERVKNPQKTIPRAIIMGTSCVAIIYIINVISVLGVTGFENLIDSKAPYALAIEEVCGHSSNVFISVLAIIVCIGTLNAWTLTGGQIAQGAAKDKLFPPIFGKTNKNGAPTAALLMAAFGIIPFFVIEQICGSEGLDYLVGLLVSIFLFVYIICAASYIKLTKKWKKTVYERTKAYALGAFSILFCIFIASQTILSSIIVLAVFIIVGLPVYMRVKKKIV